MNFMDKNETLNAPKNMTLTGVRTTGAFVTLRYELVFENKLLWTEIILNDQGREVGRTMGSLEIAKPKPLEIKAPEFSGWEKVWYRLQLLALKIYWRIFP